ncbi:MAG TPA: uroporphyrinogen-III synthase [Albitalea sp.]|nr:uroporphyrinogen-III synthase [Albitalea sp.]
MRVIVTRPAAQAAQWVGWLRGHGIDAVALPLIEIAGPPDATAVQQAWRDLPEQKLVVFVSPNAAEQFFAHAPPGALWPDAVEAASTGPGTTQALQRLAVPAAAIVEPPADAAQFDSEALWQRLAARDWRGAPVLVVRGDGGRDWLAQTLRERGAQVAFVAAYHRAAPRFDAAQRQLLDAALADPRHHLWLFSSSEAIAHLMAARAGVVWSAACALASHPRIAQHARDCGFGVVHEVRPTLEAVVACIQSIHRE